MPEIGKTDNEEAKKRKWAIRIEDALILLSIAALFFLGVFYRRETWAQIALLPVLAVMFAIFVRRMRRVKTAFEKHREDL